MAWRELPDAPHDSEGPPEMRTATVISSAAATPPGPSTVEGEGSCKVDSDCVVASAEDCCVSTCPPGRVVSSAIDASLRDKAKHCDPKAVCPAPASCQPTNVMLRPRCDSGHCKGDAISFAKGAVPGSADTIAAMQPRFDKCYQAALKKDPKTQGTTRVVVKLGADAALLSVTPTQTDGLPDDLVACLTSAIQAATFQRPVGGVGTVIIPINLTH